MAIDYKPQGRRVALGGPGSRGFSPVQAADNSQNVLRQGQMALDSFAKAQEATLTNSAKDLEALAQLSKTATTFLVDRQKGINENDRKLGIADILNGDRQPKAEALQTYRENAEQLKTAAQGEQRALNTLQETQPVQALEIRANDPVVNAWRSYGQAQGIAMQAAGSAEALLRQTMGSTDATVEVTDAQGNTRMIAPSSASTPSELNAVWAVALQRFIGTSGLDGPNGAINPLLVSELVAPAIMRIKGVIFEEQYNRIAKDQAAKAEDHTLTVMAAAIARTDFNNPVALHGLFQDGAQAFVDNVPGMTRGKANELVYDRLLQAAKGKGRVDDVTAVENTPIAEDGSDSKGTLGTRFPEKAQAARNAILAQKDADAARLKAEQKVTVENIVNAYNASILKASPDEAARAYDTTAAALAEARKQGLEGASEAEVEHSAKPRRRAGQPYLDAIIQKQIDTPGFYSKEQIQKEIADGVLPPGFDNRMTFPSDVLAPTLQGWEKRANAAAKGYFLNLLLEKNFNINDVGGAKIATRTNHLVDELMLGLRKGLAQDPNLNPDRAIEDMMKEFSKRPWYQINPTRSKTPGFPVDFKEPLEPNRISVNIGANGRSTVTDYRGFPLQPIDYKTLPIRPKDRLVEESALKEATAALKKTGSLPDNMLPAVRATGLTQTEFSRDQIKAPRGLAGLEARASQGLQEAILDNPRSTPIERVYAQLQIQRKQLLLQNQQVAPGALAPETADLLRDLGKKEGGARAYEAANRGAAMDLPNGIPGLTSMTIKQVQASGARHVGKYQFKLGQGQALAELTTRLGLTGNEKFTPELQDRMAAELIWGGWKRPALTAYLKGGGNLEQAVADFNNEWEAGKLTFNARPYLRKMRAAYQVRGAGAVGQAGNFSKANVTSIDYERKGRGDSYQPGGVDINFQDKQFPALLPGKVIEIGEQKGGYGLWVVTEHEDPKTGQPFQLINAHLDAIHVKEGQTLQTGTVLGRQGSTGTTSAGGIASIDPIMPAPRGSRAQVPYIRPAVLKELLGTLIR